jgi:predicted nucleic acid-binding protein
MTQRSAQERVLLDTSVISAFVNGEMQATEAVAFRALLERQAAGDLSFLASTVSLEEIRAIPLAYRSSHLREYESMANIRELDPTPSDNRENLALRKLLRDENDARLLTQCQRAGVSVFLTLDERTILNKASEVEAACGVKAQSPTQYFSATLRSA